MQDIIIDTCIICGNTHSEQIYIVPDHLITHESFALHACSNCRFRFIKNPPPKEDAHRYYETSEYVEHSDDNTGIINRVYHRARKWMLHYKHSMLIKEKKRKKILDFGTGTGYFLNNMKSRGFDVVGVEISTKAQDFGRENFGLEIHHPEEIYTPSFEQGFGYITLWHVLEHVYDIRKVLSRVRELLDDDGVLVVALPNYQCLEAEIYGAYWNGYDAPRHLWHFSPDQFSELAQQHGYRLKYTKVLPLDPFYNCLISESYRQKKWFNLFMPFIGLTSLILGLIDRRKASSIVYFLEKTND